MGPERESSIPTVGELVHLLADDVGRLAQPVEDLGVLEHRGHDQLVTESARALDEHADELDPPRRLRGDDVVRALR